VKTQLLNTGDSTDIQCVPNIKSSLLHTVITRLSRAQFFALKWWSEVGVHITHV